MWYSVQDVIKNGMYVWTPRSLSHSRTRQFWIWEHNKTTLIDPEVVAGQLDKAQSVVGDVPNSEILVLYDKWLYRDELEKMANEKQFHYMNYRIPSGILTNFDTLMQRVKAMNEIEQFVVSDAFETLTKKEKITYQRNLLKLQRTYKGVKYLTKKPSLVIVVDGMAKPKFIDEVIKTRIPSIVVTSSDFDRWVAWIHIVLLNTNSYTSIDAAMNYLFS